MKRGMIYIALALAASACSSPQHEDQTTPRREEPDRPPLPPSGPPTGGEIPRVPRAQLDRVLGQSVGDFLGRHVEVEPEHSGGSFFGWRIVELRVEPPAWLDLRRGDVVIAINRMPLEHPEDAQRVFETLRISSEILIDLRRDGQPLSIRIPIDDGEPEPVESTPEPVESGEPPPEPTGE